jgi:hypothetical protein
LFADLRYAVRVMSRRPSFAAAVIGVLALGIGATTTIFSIVNAVLLRPLPFEEPERLVRIYTLPLGGTPSDLSAGKFHDWRRDAHAFEGMAIYGSREVALTGTGAARAVNATAVSADFFGIVKARPALGRVFRQDEDTPVGKYACANVGNLLFTRALNRRTEMAIRSALRAGRGRVLQQLLSDALLLAGAGGAFGLLLAYGTLMSASTLLAGQVPRAGEISIDGRVLLFALVVSLLTGVLAGTLPAVRAGRSDLGGLNGALKEGGRGDATVGVGARRASIVCEVALSLVLLMGAGVMVQTLLALRHVDTGFDPNNVLTMRVRLVEARYPTRERRSAFLEAALQRIRALPGVEAAGTVDDLPFAAGSAQVLRLEGYPPRIAPPVVQVRHVTSGYLRAMGIPVLRGRDILDALVHRPRT